MPERFDILGHTAKAAGKKIGTRDRVCSQRYHALTQYRLAALFALLALKLAFSRGSRPTARDTAQQSPQSRHRHSTGIVRVAFKISRAGEKQGRRTGAA
jgi:hypothetical protein